MQFVTDPAAFVSLAVTFGTYGTLRREIIQHLLQGDTATLLLQSGHWLGTYFSFFRAPTLLWWLLLDHLGHRFLSGVDCGRVARVMPNQLISQSSLDQLLMYLFGQTTLSKLSKGAREGGAAGDITFTLPATDSSELNV